MESNLQSLEAEWDDFAKLVFGGSRVSPTQVQEMKKAFFAGATTILAACNRIGDDDVSEDEGVAYMEARWDEAMAFYHNMMREYGERN